MKVYIVEAHDDWNDSHYIRDVFATKEAAIADLMKYNADLVYDEQSERYEHTISFSDTTVYYMISEYDVRN